MPRRKRTTPFGPTILLMIACCEGIAIGLIIPTLPTLFGRAAGDDNAAFVFGLALGIYALTNMLALPVLGSLSDRWGRRPLLLLSLAVMAVDFMMMAVAPILAVLLAFRVLSGLTNATSATLAAALADGTPVTDRTRWFGYLNACYGLGFVVGPLAGGALAEVRLEAPYVLASVLVLLGFALTLRLPDLQAAKAGGAIVSQRVVVNPLTHLMWLGAAGLAPLALVYFAVRFSFESPNVLWAIYTAERFQFTPSTIGLTLAVFGLVYTIVQVFLAGPIERRIGAGRTALLGVAVDATSMFTLAFTSVTWLIFPLLVPLSFGSIALPALQSQMSRQVERMQQGRLQGALSSVVALATVVAPLACSAAYAATSGSAVPGAAWLLPVAVYVVTVPIWLFSRRRTGRSEPSTMEA